MKPFALTPFQALHKIPSIEKTGPRDSVGCPLRCSSSRDDGRTWAPGHFVGVIQCPEAFVDALSTDEMGKRLMTPLRALCGGRSEVAKASGSP
jgi:hypothetical protein